MSGGLRRRVPGGFAASSTWCCRAWSRAEMCRSITSRTTGCWILAAGEGTQNYGVFRKGSLLASRRWSEFGCLSFCPLQGMCDHQGLEVLGRKGEWVSWGRGGENSWQAFNQILTEILVPIRSMLQSPSDRARKGLPISPSRALQPAHLKAPRAWAAAAGSLQGSAASVQRDLCSLIRQLL